MAFAQDLPHSFQEGLNISKRILSANLDLVSQNLVETEAELLVLAAYRKATSHLLSRLEMFLRISDPFPAEAAKQLLIYSGARAAGKPLQYITGFQSFIGHEYEVNPSVLIPRQETECLIAAAFSRLDSQKNPPKKGIEIGIGSGILSIELLHRYPGLRMIASEFSQSAKEVAIRNAERILGSTNGMDRLEIVLVAEKDQVFEPFSQSLELADLIISNPPYLAEDLNEVSLEVLSHEPREALFAPSGDLLYFYKKMAEEAKRYLKPNGHLFAELPHERSGDILDLFRDKGWQTEVSHDLTQRERVFIAW